MKIENILKASQAYHRLIYGIEKNLEIIGYDARSFKRIAKLKKHMEISKKKINSLKMSKYSEFISLNPKLIFALILEKTLFNE